MDELPEGRIFRVIDFFKRTPEVIILSVLVFMYLILSNIYAYPATFDGSYFPTSGGSDPFYNWRVILYTLQTHHWITYDTLLNYPLGARNPRTPLIHFVVILSAYIISPFYNLIDAGKIGLLEVDAVFGALLIIPVYLITKELMNKRAGLVGAVLYTLMPSNLSAGILSDGRMHTPELLFAFFSIYFFQKSLNTITKERIYERLLNFGSYYSSAVTYLKKNTLGIIYILLAGASFGALALAWQGFEYIEAIVAIFIFIQLVFNLFLKRPTGYFIVLTALFFLMGLSLPAYYYITLGNATGWLYPAVELALVTIGFSVLVAIVGRRPWLIALIILAIISGIAIAGIYVLDYSFLHRLISGAGYFVKTRVYQTIGEASSPPLGQYIAGFGAAQFLLGMGGLAYVTYLYLKKKNESLLFFVVFSVISIYMSFAAARFNITAAPAYAALGAVLLVYLADAVNIRDLKNRRASVQMGIRKSMKGNIKGLHIAFVLLIVLGLVMPSGLSMVNAAVPANNAIKINNEIYNALPSFLKPFNYSSTNYQFVGSFGFYVTNDTQPLSQSLLWLGNQDLNLPINERPGYVSWWDYGFQEIIQGKHPTVADDFQQGYRVAGQVLLAQNESVIISLFLARELQAAYSENGNSLSQPLFNALSQYLGYGETKNISNFLKDPSNYTYLISSNPKIYGEYISGIDSENAYFALVSGQLASKFPVGTIVNVYQQVSAVTGSYIKYIQTPEQLFPFSGNNTGIFYAPTYLTDHVTYNYRGEVVPYQYYNIMARTQNSSYPLNKLPNSAIPIGYNIQYNSAFYNTSIYRFLIGYPPSAVGQSGGIPGITYGQNNLTLEPAWGMSNFIIDYYPILYNPHKNFTSYPKAWKLVSLQQGYKYRQEGKGTVLLFPPPDQILTVANPIVAYYPGAFVTGRVTTASGLPVQGAYVTIFDQYGIPHQYVKTNAQGYYNLTGLPGNDTVIISHGRFSNYFLTGKTVIDSFKVNVTQDQANRIPIYTNVTSGLPDYYIVHNYQLPSSHVSGAVYYQNQYLKKETKANIGYKNTRIENGTVTFTNSTYNESFSAPIIDGSYVINDLPPYNYTVSLETGGKVYKDLLLASPTVGSSVVYDVYVHFDVIFAQIQSSAGPSLSGFNISATSRNGNVYGVTNASGQAILWVNPGNYSVTASGLNSVSVSSSVSFSTWDKNATVNLTPEVSAKLSGYILNSMGSVDITFYSNAQLGDIFTSINSSTGSYNVILPVGIYTVYATNGNNAFIQTLTLVNNTILNMILSKGCNATMTSTMKGQKSYYQNFEILSFNAYLETPLLGGHTFSMLLPTGQYEFAAYSLTAGNRYSGFTSKYLIGYSSFNIALSFNNNLSVQVYDKSSGSGYNSHTAVSHDLAVLYYSDYPIYFSYVTYNGTTTLEYPYLDNSLLSVKVFNSLYQTNQVSISGKSVNIPLNPLYVNTSFVFGDQNINGTVKLSGPSTYSSKISNGVSSLSVRPGLYRLSVSSRQMYLNLSNNVIAIQSTSNYTYLPPYVKAYSINITGSGELSVFSPSGKKVNSGFLPGGNYTAYAQLGNEASIAYVNIKQNTTLEMKYAGGYTINLGNSLGQTGGTYTITSNGHPMNFTETSVLLPTGSYTISYNDRISGTSGDYIILGSAKVSVSAQEIVNVTVTKRQVYSIVSGHVTNDNISTIYMYNSKGNLVNQTTTNNGGYYSIGVSGGSYTLYALNASGSKAFIETYIISPFKNRTVDFRLNDAYLTYLHTSVGGVKKYIDVSIVTTNLSFKYNSSNSYIILPSHTYAFGASLERNYLNYTGVSSQVTYQDNQTVFVGGITYINLNLQRVNYYSFKMTQITKTQTASPRSSLNYTFTFLNTGNSNVTVKFASGNVTWPMSFNANNVTLNSGQKINETVTLTKISPYAPAGINRIPIKVNYGHGNFTGYITVKVQKVFNFTLSEVSTVALTNGSRLLIPVNITNTGNTPIAVSLNLNTTVIQIYGWNAYLTFQGSNVSKITLGFNQTDTLYIVLTPGNGSQTKSGYVILSASAQSGSISATPLKINVGYPASPKLKTFPFGPSILANYTGNPIGSLILGIIIIVVAVVGGLATTALRGRRRGGR